MKIFNLFLLSFLHYLSRTDSFYKTTTCSFIVKKKNNVKDLKLSQLFMSLPDIQLLLSDLGLDFEEVDVQVSGGSKMSEVITERFLQAKSSTVPKIYVKSEYVGGCDDLIKELDSKVFYERLKRNNITWTDYKPKETSEFIKSNIDYTQTSRSITDPLNEYKEVNDLKDNILTPLELSQAIQKEALILQDKFSSDDGIYINYNDMKSSIEFQNYIKLTSFLQSYNLPLISNLSDDIKKSMFINLYNGLIMHGKCVVGPPQDSPEARSSFFNGSTGVFYKISGYNFSPDDIEHGIIRANHPHPSSTGPTYFKSEDPRALITVSQLDPRIHFALNCGAVSCPPIRIYGSGDIETELDTAANAYLSSEIQYDSALKRLYLPKLALWYQRDFGETIIEQVTRLLSLLRTPKRLEIVNEMMTASTWSPSFITNQNNSYLNPSKPLIEVIYNYYDWSSNGL